VQENDEFWMYDELKTRVTDAQTLRDKFVNGNSAVKDKDSDKMIASKIAQVMDEYLALHQLIKGWYPGYHKREKLFSTAMCDATTASRIAHARQLFSTCNLIKGTAINARTSC